MGFGPPLLPSVTRWLSHKTAVTTIWRYIYLVNGVTKKKLLDTAENLVTNIQLKFANKSIEILPKYLLSIRRSKSTIYKHKVTYHFFILQLHL